MDITIPSEERTLLMYPMDFEEFAWAMNEEPLITYKRRGGVSACLYDILLIVAGIPCMFRQKNYFVSFFPHKENTEKK